MKKILLLFIHLVFCNLMLSQCSLDSMVVQKVKRSTVRIVTENDVAVGTGFFINDKCLIATCWHVISPFLQYNADSTALTVGPKIFIQLVSGEKIEAGIVDYCLKEGSNEARIYDYCLLAPVKGLGSIDKFSFDYFFLGNLESIPEGKLLYTCGYPLGIKQQFLSGGLLSTKYSEDVSIAAKGGETITSSVEKALVDITMNRGNSGGAVFYVGNSNEIVVVGIATYILGINLAPAEALSNYIQKITNEGTNAVIEASGVDFMGANKLLLQAVAYNSVGISGLYSVKYLRSTYEMLLKK